MLKNPNIRTKSEFLAALTDCVLSRGVAGGGAKGARDPPFVICHSGRGYST